MVQGLPKKTDLKLWLAVFLSFACTLQEIASSVHVSDKEFARTVIISEYEGLTKPKILKFSWKSVSFPKDPSERWQEEY